jgi:hypothetical protein
MREEFGNDIGVIVAFKDESGIFNKKPYSACLLFLKKFFLVLLIFLHLKS